MFIRPGPESIPPGANPGGVVVQLYSVPSCVLVLTQHVNVISVELLAMQAGSMVDAVGIDNVCLVAFDGDTGERYTADDWQP